MFDSYLNGYDKKNEYLYYSNACQLDESCVITVIVLESKTVIKNCTHTCFRCYGIPKNAKLYCDCDIKQK